MMFISKTDRLKCIDSRDSNYFTVLQNAYIMYERELIMDTKSDKRSYKEIISDWLWPEGTYGERPPDAGAVIRKNMDKIREVQKVIQSQISRKKNSSQH